MVIKALNSLSKILRLASTARARHGWFSGWRPAGLLVLTLCLTGMAQAATVNGLYEGTVRVKDRSEATRVSSFVTALNMVLIKVSGRADAPTRIGNAANNASRYVQRYSYVAGGLMDVGFDSAAVNTLLEQAGLPLWDRERPTTLVVYPQSLHGMHDATSATETTARIRGVPITWANSENSEDLATATPAQLQELARRYDAAAVLIAHLTPNAAMPPSLRWQMVFNGSSEETTGTAEDGPNLAAEVLGRYYAAAGKDSTRLFMEVAGVDNLDAYAKTLSYVNGLLMVRAVSVESLQRDVLRLRLDLRGNPEALRRTLTVDRKLVEQDSAPINATANVTSQPNQGILAYRYAP